MKLHPATFHSKNSFTFDTKQATLMRRSTELSLPLLLVFLAKASCAPVANGVIMTGLFAKKLANVQLTSSPLHLPPNPSEIKPVYLVTGTISTTLYIP
jgi:hypothetical protein